MSLKNIVKGAVLKPIIFILYGVAGIGKTSTASTMPNPVYIQTEDGLAGIKNDENIWSFPVCNSYDEVIDNLKTLRDDEHDRQSLIIDSLDWLQKLVLQKVCQIYNKQSVAEIPYGQGYTYAADLLEELLDIIYTLRNDKKMRVCMICHVELKRIEIPDIDPHDKYQLKLHKSISAKFSEFADAIFFMNYKYGQVKKQADKGNMVTKTTQSKDRYIFTTETSAHVGKNRYNLPDEIKLEKDKGWEILSEAMKEGLNIGK